MDGSTPFVALAIHRCSLAGFVAVLLFRELGKESSEAKLSSKCKAHGKTAKMRIQRTKHSPFGLCGSDALANLHDRVRDRKTRKMS